MIKIILTALTVVSVIVPVFGQAAGQQKKIADLDFLTGKWRVEVNTRLAAQGPWDKSVATATIRKSLNSTLLEENFSGSREGKPFMSLTLFAVNNQSGKYQRTFADSEHGVLVDFEGDRTQDVLNFEKTWTYTNGSTVKLRVTYKIVSKDEITVESMRMPQDSTQWDITGRMRYIRSK